MHLSCKDDSKIRKPDVLLIEILPNTTKQGTVHALSPVYSNDAEVY